MPQLKQNGKWITNSFASFKRGEETQMGINEALPHGNTQLKIKNKK